MEEMKKNSEIDVDCNSCEDTRTEKSIVIPAAIILLAISLPAIFFTDQTAAFLKSLFIPINKTLGSGFLWLVVLLTLYLAYLAVSKWGDIKFGNLEEEPEFKLGPWSAMIFTSGVAGAVMFWAIVEPAWYLVTPPLHVEVGTPEAYEWSLALLFLNWGPTAWASFFMCALPIAYIFHIRCKSLLRVSAASEIIIGEQKDKFLGRALDVCFILGLMFCTATTMCLSLPTVEACLAKVFGLTPSVTLQRTILFCTVCFASVSTYFGLKRGIKNLASFNVIIAFAMMGYIFLVGPSVTLFDSFTGAIGRAYNNFFVMTLWTDPFSEGSVPQDWTMFYAMFWLAYGPFMGLFIARISRGRTVREIITYGLFSAVMGGYVIHGVLASYTLHLSYSGALDVVGILQSQGGAALMAEVFASVPFGNVILILYCLVSTVFLATSLDSSCYVMAASSVKCLNIGGDPDRSSVLSWLVIQAILAMGILTIGGLEIAKMLGNLGGIVMCIPVVLLAFCWAKILRTSGDELLYHHTVQGKYLYKYKA